MLTAFVRQLGSTPLLCALTQLERLGVHPVGGEDYNDVGVTAAGG